MGDASATRVRLQTIGGVSRLDSCTDVGYEAFRTVGEGRGRGSEPARRRVSAVSARPPRGATCSRQGHGRLAPQDLRRPLLPAGASRRIGVEAGAVSRDLG